MILQVFARMLPNLAKTMQHQQTGINNYTNNYLQVRTL